MQKSLVENGIHDLFKNIVISNKLRSIRSIFRLNNDETHSLNYAPSYQRNYIWSDVKSTYLIETILLHGEIPPIVIYILGQNWEVIDGRQRCQTIERYIQGEFSLKPHGLDKLWHLAGKKFSQLEEKLQDRIRNTNLRLITITTSGDSNINPHTEELMKREIFKRYNLGIIPLKTEEVFKAIYLQDDINIYFKKQFEKNKQLYHQLKDLFDHKSKNLETIMQYIRQILVLHNIPINKFIHGREDIVNMYYDFLSYNVVNKGKLEHVQLIFNDFIEKFHFLLEIKAQLNKNGISSTGIIYECLYWALSVCEKEKIVFASLNNNTFKTRLINHLTKQAHNYPIERHNHASQIIKRYSLISSFFTSQLNLSFLRYLKSDEEFLVEHTQRMNNYMKERFTSGREQEYFSKPLSTSNSINDILDRMKRGKFNLRPPYQRNEVMDIRKASALIESMLLGLKINPLYIYLRKNGVAEVIDGQQRLLAIIGFLGEQYLNENGEIVMSKKNKFKLHLTQGYLTHLGGKAFNQLSNEEQATLKNYDLDIIEIKEENNIHFKPEELFKRLNYKSMPIKPDTFEFWNAYVDSEIINAIKGICERHSWLYLRKDDKRMFNQELVTRLCYLHFMTKATPNMENIREILDIQKRKPTITLLLKKKTYLTHILENPIFKADFLLALNDFELGFIEKVKLLIVSSQGKKTEFFSPRRLDALLHTSSIRLAMSFYLLWAILKGIPIESIRESQSAILRRINKVFSILRTADSVERFEKAISEAWIFPVAVSKPE
ncbi:DUF262 domain-containing protein [Chitinophaga defluvii]|uniref:DUF262 domain-containing protein n=1 Tax=Chitinophaga defluvii TaxID=3163343 RepID=A0ABV2T133_9BACT